MLTTHSGPCSGCCPCSRTSTSLTRGSSTTSRPSLQPCSPHSFLSSTKRFLITEEKGEGRRGVKRRKRFNSASIPLFVFIKRRLWGPFSKLHIWCLGPWKGSQTLNLCNVYIRRPEATGGPSDMSSLDCCKDFSIWPSLVRHTLVRPGCCQCVDIYRHIHVSITNWISAHFILGSHD